MLERRVSNVWSRGTLRQCIDKHTAPGTSLLEGLSVKIIRNSHGLKRFPRSAQAAQVRIALERKRAVQRGASECLLIEHQDYRRGSRRRTACYLRPQDYTWMMHLEVDGSRSRRTALSCGAGDVLLCDLGHSRVFASVGA